MFFLFDRSLTCREAVTSGLSSNLEFLHFKDLIKRFLNLYSLPILSFRVLFLELTLSKILISIKLPSEEASFFSAIEYELYRKIKKNTNN